MQPYAPNAPSKAEVLVAALKARPDDALCKEAAGEIERLREQEYRLAARINQQRCALRDNWMIVERRAAHRRAWVRSPLLFSMLKTRRRQLPKRWQKFYDLLAWAKSL